MEGDEDIVPEINPGNNASDDNKPSVRPVRKPEVEADEDVATGDGNMTLYIAILGLSAATLAVIMGRKKNRIFSRFDRKDIYVTIYGGISPVEKMTAKQS